MQHLRPPLYGPEWRHAHRVHIKCLAQPAFDKQSRNVVAAAVMMMTVVTVSFLPFFQPRAIQESLLASSKGLCPGASSGTSRFDSDLQLAMELSAKELEEQELRLREEEAELQQVLQLSLTEK